MKPILWFVLGVIVAFSGQALAETFLRSDLGPTTTYSGQDTQTTIIGNWYSTRDQRTGRIVQDGYLFNANPYGAKEPC